MKIQNFQSAWPYCYDVLQRLKQKTYSLNKITNHQKLITKEEYMNTYNKIYTYCTDRQENSSQKLYKKYEEILNNYLIDTIKEFESASQIYKLKKIRNIWNSYKFFLKNCKNLFVYLDRFYIPQSSLVPLQKKGLNIFKQIMLENEHYEQITTTYLKQIEKIRITLQYINCPILKEFVQIFIEINDKAKICEKLFNNFESRYLYAANEYYKKKFKELQKLSCQQYLIQIRKLYQSEMEIFENCFNNPKSIKKLNQQFNKQLVKKYKSHLLQKSTGLIPMLQNNKVQILKLINQIYKKLDNFDQLKQKFSQYIQKEFKQLLDNKKSDLEKGGHQNQINFIREIFKFHKIKYSLLQECFHGNTDFNYSYNFAIEKILNEYNSIYNISEILAKYSDGVIREKKLSQEQFQEEIKYILSIFNCLVDKDIYLKTYREFLAKRLISENNPNLDNEKSFISKLKQNCGVIFTQSIESIISDYYIGQQESKNFKKYFYERFKKQDFQVIILSQGIWPTQQLFQLQLPEEIENYKITFNQYFNLNSKFRFKNYKFSYLQSKLTYTFFVHDSIRDLKQNKFAQVYLEMNTLQASLLYYIYRNRPYMLTQQSILSQFNQIPPGLVLGNLKILCEGTHNIVLKKFDEERNENIYSFNLYLVTKRKRIQYSQYVNQIVQKKESQVDNDRSLAIQMAIVKIMKTRKKLKFELLIDEVLKILKNFHPTVKQIKQSIQRMTLKDYIQRDPKQINEYRYKE